MCTRTYRLLEMMPLDSEVQCATHPKETVLHYDHSRGEFRCLQCERIESLSLRQEVVETDRRVILKSMHVITELIKKKINEMQQMLAKIE